MSLDFYLRNACCRREYFSRNITHNMNKMAEACGLYGTLWHPRGGDIMFYTNITEHIAYDQFQIVTGFYKYYENADAMIPDLKKGLECLEKYPEHFKQFNPTNGWGNYEGFIEFVKAVLDACIEYPETVPYASI